MNVIVLDYSNGSVNIVHDISDDLSSFEIEKILNKNFHLSNCSWMSTYDYNIYHCKYDGEELIFEGY